MVWSPLTILAAFEQHDSVCESYSSNTILQALSDELEVLSHFLLMNTAYLVKLL